MSDAHHVSDHERRAHETVDEAFRSYPLSPAPATLYRSTMARVKAARRAPKFQLGWLDYALSLLVALMAGLMIVVLRGIPPRVLESTRIEVLLAVQQIDWLLIWPVILGCLAFAFLIAAIAAAVVNGSHYRPVRPQR